MARGNFAYPRAMRLRRRRDFHACYDHGQRSHCRHFVIFALPAPHERPVTGVAVSRKVGNAVARNRVKRLLREFFRLHKDKLPGGRLVAVAKKNAATIDFAQLERELCDALSRIAT